MHGNIWLSRVAWIATLLVDLFVLGSGLWIIGADGGASIQFAAFAFLIVVIKAISWSRDWKFLGALGAAIGIFFFGAYGIMHYDLAVPLASEERHGALYTQLSTQLSSNNQQLLLPDLSKESRVALLAANTSLNLQIKEEAEREREVSRPRLTTRHLFSSMVSLPKAEAAKLLCWLMFTLFGVLLEVAVFRITPRVHIEAPRRSDVARTKSQPLTYTSTHPNQRSPT